MSDVDTNRSLVVKVTDDELNQIHRLAKDEERTVATVVRRLLREAYASRFGETPAPQAKLRRGK